MKKYYEDHLAHLLSFIEEKDYTRAELVALTGSPRSTIYGRLNMLIERGLVEKYAEKERRNQGRPKIYFRRIQ